MFVDKNRSLFLRFFAAEPENGGGKNDEVNSDNSSDEEQVNADQTSEETTADESAPKEEESAADDADKWRKHARNWQKKAEKNLAEIQRLQSQLEKTVETDQLDAVKAERDAAKQQLAIVSALISSGANAAVLYDSRSFMAKAEELDPDSEGFIDEMKALIAGFHSSAPQSSQKFYEGNSTQTDDLWELVHGKKANKH